MNETEPTETDDLGADDRAMLDLLAAKPDYPTLSNLAELAVDRGVSPSVGEACRQLHHLYGAGEIESFDVDGFGPFLAVKGRLPNASDLPKAGDEIELRADALDVARRAAAADALDAGGQ